MSFVQLPQHDQAHWKHITDTLTLGCSIKSAHELQQVIGKICPNAALPTITANTNEEEDAEHIETVLTCSCSEFVANNENGDVDLFGKVIPFIVSLVLKTPSILHEPIPILQQRKRMSQ